MPKMRSNFRGLVTLLAKNLYPEPDVFVRELIQNAHDGIQLRRVMQPEHTGQIQITTEPANRTITFSDDGLGMDKHVIEEFLSTIGSSGTGTMTAELKQGARLDVATIGQFGIGLLSAFVVAERIDVYTRHLESDEAWHWVNVGDDEYTLDATSEMPHTGTQVILTVKREFAEYLQEETLQATIRKYADLIPIPIFINGRGPVNEMRPPWEVVTALPPTERDQYLGNYLCRRFPDTPLLIIPVSLPHLQTQGLLYITDQPIPGLNTSGFVNLYQNRMSLRARDTELLPEWARFVRGIVDSRSLQPTAARDNVHRDEAWFILQRALGELIIQSILDCATHSPDYFAKLCRWHHFHFKGLCVTDDRFFDRMILQLPFETSEGPMSLEQFRVRQTETAGQATTIHYFSSDADSARFYELCRARRIIALNAGWCFEEALLRKLVERQPGQWLLRRLDNSDSDELYRHLPQDAEEAFAPLLAAVSRELVELGLTHIRVGVRHFEPATSSAVLLDIAGHEKMDQLRQMLNHPAAFQGLAGLRGEISDVLEKRELELLLNAANPLVQQLAEAGSWDNEAEKLALRGVYFAALLQSKGRLSSANTAGIHKLLLESLAQVLSLHSARGQARREIGALHKLVEDRNNTLTGAEWIAACRALYPDGPARFRDVIAAASDEMVAQILANLLTLNVIPATVSRLKP